MSGHSKWSTIKHKKAIEDNRRGKIFTKLGKAVTIAVKDGGADETVNFKLRLAIDKAKQFNMPKANIKRAIERGSGQGSGQGLIEVIYEGFGPGRIAVIVEAVTDNKNRTAAVVKKMFEKAGGSIGQSGTVGYLFEKKGRIVVELIKDKDSQMLKLIDLGADDVELIKKGIEVLVEANKLGKVRDEIEKQGFNVKQAELFYQPVSLVNLETGVKKKVMSFLEELDGLDDVVEVYTNLKF